MIVLSLEHLLEIHSLVLAETDGGEGLRDLGRLEAAIAVQMLAGLTLLKLNNIEFQTSPGEIENYAVEIATKHIDIKEISNWLNARLAQNRA